MRTTLDIDDDLLQAVKELGALHGKTAGQMMSDLARKGLAPTPASGARVRNGVPLLPKVSGAPIMTLADVNRLRNEV